MSLVIPARRTDFTVKDACFPRIVSVPFIAMPSSTVVIQMEIMKAQAYGCAWPVGRHHNVTVVKGTQTGIASAMQ